MASIGQHYSSTAGKTVQGHDIVLTHYMLLGRGCPQQPDLYRQQAACEHEKLPFKSKIDLMQEQIQRFVPPPGTKTHVLLDSWYGCKRLWKLARTLGYAITTGLKSNRWLWVADETASGGGDGDGAGGWQRLSEYAANLSATDYQEVEWPSQHGGHKVWVHVVRTRVRKLYTCQLVVVRESLDGPVSGVRYWASSDLEADAGADRAYRDTLGHRGADCRHQGNGAGPIPVVERGRDSTLVDAGVGRVRLLGGATGATDGATRRIRDDWCCAAPSASGASTESARLAVYALPTW